MEAFRRVVIPVLGLGGLFFTMRLFLAYLPIYYRSIGFTPTQIGLLMAAFPLSYLLLSFPLGRLSDRYTPKMLAIFGLMLFGLSLAIFGDLIDFYQFLGVVIAGSVGVTLFEVSCVALFYKSIGDKHHGKKFGFINAGLMIGSGAGPFVGGYLLRYGGFETFFAIVPLSLLPVVLLSIFLVRESDEIQNNLDLKRVLARRETVIFLLLIFLFALHIGAEDVWFSLFFKEEIHLGEEMIGVVYLAIGIALASSSVVAGFLADRVRHPSVLLWSGLLISGILNMLLPMLNTFTPVVVSRLIHVAGDSIFLLAFRLVVLRFFHTEGIGGGIGLTQTTFTLGILIGSILSGLFASPEYPFFLAGAISIASIPLALLLSRSLVHSPAVGQR